MWISTWDIGDFVPIIALSIPIVAIIGGITAGIIRTLGRQRMVELAQRERIAAIERGVDPAKLAPLPVAALDEEAEHWTMSQYDRDRKLAQGLLIGGIVTTATGLGLMAFLNIMDEGNAWAVGIIPGTIGVALLISSFLVRPKRNGGGSSTSPQSN